MAQGNAGILEEKLADLLFAEAVTMDGLHVLRTQDHDGFMPSAHAITPHRGQSMANGAQDRLDILRGMLADAARRLGGKQGERALVAAKTALHVQRLPGAFFFIFGNAEGEFAGIAERRHIDAIGPGSAQIEQQQLQRAPQRAVGPGHIAENILLRPEAKLVAHRSVDHDEWRGKMRGGLDAVCVEALVTCGAHQRRQDAHHLRQAAGHHRVGGDLFHRGFAIAGRYASDHALRRQRTRLEHGGHALGCGRHDGKPVTKLAEAKLDLVISIGQGDAAG